jgi:glycine betaine/choline ABC-type transport system substrate-binding protein
MKAKRRQATWITRWALLGLSAVLACATLAGCPKQPEGLASMEEITVGSKNFTEQKILGHMFADLIDYHTDCLAERRVGLQGTLVCFNALCEGDIDLYPEYTGTGLTAILKEEVISDPQQAYEHVKSRFDERWNLVWLEPLGFNNTYTLTMREDQAEELGITRISDLARYADELKPAFDHEFLSRPDGYDPLTRAYGFRFGEAPVELDPGLMYRALADGRVDVIDAFLTDGRIPAFGLRVLEDDRHFFPPYYAAPLVRREVLDAHPALRDALGRLAGQIDNEAMAKMNYEVDEEHRSAREVAHEFLQRRGLIPEDDAAE